MLRCETRVGYEEKVFADRVGLAARLRTFHLIEPTEAEETIALDSPDQLRDFRRWGQTYDRLIALHFYENDLKKDNPTSTFISLQNMAYLGLALGVKDIKEQEAAEELEYQSSLATPGVD